MEANGNVAIQKYVYDVARRQPWNAIILAIITVIALAYRVNNLDAKSLWVDEIGQVLASRDGFVAAINGASKHFGAAPFDYLITHATIRTLGQGDAAVRIPAVIWGTLAVPLIYSAGISIFGSRKVAMLSAILIAFNPAHIQYSQEARWYSLSTTLSLLTANLVILAIVKKKIFIWLCISVVFLLSVLTAMHHVLTIGAIFLALAIAWLLQRNRTESDSFSPTMYDLLASVVASMPAAFFVLYWYFSGSLRSEVGNAFHFEVVSLNHLILWPVFGNYGTPARPWSYPPPIFGLVVFPLFVSIGLISSAFRRNVRALIPFMILIIGGVGIYLIDLTSGYFWAYRQFLYLVPFSLLFVSAGFVSTIRIFTNNYWVTWTAIALASLVTVYYTLPQVDVYYSSAKSNWRGTALLLYQISDNPDTAIYYSDEYHRYLSFYQPSLREQLNSPNTLSAETLSSGPNKRIWYYGPTAVLDELHQAGWNSIKVNTGLLGAGGGPLYYLGQDEVENLYLELAELNLPPEVFASGFLLNLGKVDQQLALELGNESIRGFGRSYFPTTPRIMANIVSDVSRLYFDMGQRDKALTLVNWAVELDQTSLDALANQGYYLLSTGSVEEAVKPLERCVYLYPKFYWCHSFLASGYSKLDEPMKAAKSHEKASEFTHTEERKQMHLRAAIDEYISVGENEEAERLQVLVTDQ